MKRNRLIVGVSGASGIPCAIEMLRRLRSLQDVESHLIVTEGARRTLEHESGLSFDDLIAMADVYYDNGDIGAAPASGSFSTLGMVIVPCSMKTVAGIASGYSDNLLLRAADVTLKEQRPLVLGVREAPFSSIHLRNMYELSRLGVEILPLTIAYYTRPKTVAECTAYTVERMLRTFGLGNDAYQWSGTA